MKNTTQVLASVSELISRCHVPLGFQKRSCLMGGPFFFRAAFRFGSSSGCRLCRPAVNSHRRLAIYKLSPSSIKPPSATQPFCCSGSFGRKGSCHPDSKPAARHSLMLENTCLCTLVHVHARSTAIACTTHHHAFPPQACSTRNDTPPNPRLTSLLQNNDVIGGPLS